MQKESSSYESKLFVLKAEDRREGVRTQAEKYSAVKYGIYGREPWFSL